MRLASALLCLLLAPGCAPTELRVVSSTELGPLQTNPRIQAREGGHSALWEGRSLWVYGDTILSEAGADGALRRDNTASWTEDIAADATTGITGFTEHVDAHGVPEPLFPVTPAEADYNAAHAGPGCQPADHDPCGSRELLWPGPLVADPDRGRALAFWWKVRSEPGGYTGLGMGIAEWNDPDALPERPVIDVETRNPTVLFPAEGLTPGNAAVLDNHWLYAFACPGDEQKRCRLGRVRAEDAQLRSEWQWYLGLGDWSYDQADAAPLFDGSDTMSLHRSRHLDRWVVIYSEPRSNTVVARTAEALEGPWSEAAELFRTVAPTEPDTWSYAGLGHAEFADEGKEYVTYYRNTGVWTGEIRLVEVELEMAGPNE